MTTGASNDIEQATKLARAMISRFGMSEEFGFVAFETVSNQYLGGDASLACSPETQARMDQKVTELVSQQYRRAAELLRDRELDVDLYVLGSTQEEPHSTGAIAAAYGIAPDCCVAVDVTHGDSPDASKDKTFPLGGGPVIGLGPNCTRWMARRLERKAEELGLDVQLEVMAGSSGTNGWPMQISREGIATAVLSLPLRYMHTPIETVHRDDLDHTAQLLDAFLEGLGEEAEAL